jgi:hypothetical protein
MPPKGEGGKDRDLGCGVEAGQVFACVSFRVAEATCLSERVRERCSLFYRVSR